MCLGWTDVNNNKALSVGADLLHQQRRDASCRRPRRTSPTSAKVTGQAQNPKGPKGRFHMLNPLEPCDLHAHAGPEGGEGLPALADGPEAGRRAGTTSRSRYYAPFLHTYDDAPMWKAEPRNLPYRDSLQDVASAGLAGAAQPGAVGERGEIRRRRHVRQGLRRQVDQGGHRRRQGAAEADLQAGVDGCRRQRLRRRWTRRRPRVLASAAGRSARACSAG